MLPGGCRTWTAGLAIVAVVLLCATICLSIKLMGRQANLHYAFDIVGGFGDKAAAASKGSASEACDILWQLYYPSFEWSGAPHPFQGTLNSFVESQRRRAVAEVIRYLRTKTGDNLGPDPEQWILRYGSQSTKDGLEIMKTDCKDTSSNLQSGANGRQPSSLETNQASATAASRRSP